MRCRSILPILWCGLVVAGESPTHWAEGDVAVVELEELLPAKGWVVETAQAGFTGRGYIADQGGGEALTMRVIVPEAGRWHIALRNRHDHADSTLENDCWLSVDGGQRVKTFSSKAGEWTWQTKLEPKSHSFAEPVYDLAAGEHEIVLSGRSAGFRIDRLHLFREGTAGADDVDRPATPYLPALPSDGDRTMLAAWQRGDLGKALLAARKAADAAATARLEIVAAARHAALIAAYADAPAFATGELARWATCWRGSDQGKAFADEAAVWSKEPAYRDAQAARRALDGLRPAIAKLLERLASGAKVPGTQPADAVKALQRLAERWPGVPAATEAQALVAQIQAAAP